jgi:hypothetical protein
MSPKALRLIESVWRLSGRSRGYAGSVCWDSIGLGSFSLPPPDTESSAQARYGHRLDLVSCCDRCQRTLMGEEWVLEQFMMQPKT